MTGYVRKDTTNNIADGNVINAADLDAEFDGVQDAFNASTGHKHDGTAGEGATINALGPTQDVTISSTLLAPKTTNTVDIGSSSLKFKDLFLAGNGSVGGTLAVTGVATFTAQPILSSLTASRAVFSDGSKGLVSNAITGTGNVVMSASPTLTGTAGFENITASGTLGVTGVATFTAQPIVSSLTASRAVFSDGSKGLVSNAITGTGNVVMSASPTLTGTISAESLTASSSVTLSGGTANGVAYLNGSKVLTSGSALTWNTTTFGVGGATVNTAGDNVDFDWLTLKSGVSAGNKKAIVWQDSGGTVLGRQYLTYTSPSASIVWGSLYNGGANNSDLMTLTPTGLGIGTSSPSSKLSIAASTTAANADIELGNSAGVKNYVFTGGSTNATTRWRNNLVLYTGGAQDILFETNATERMRLDSAGNLGLGVTPSAWVSGAKMIQFPYSATGSSADGYAIMLNNAFEYSANAFKYSYSGLGASMYRQTFGDHDWKVAGAGTAGGIIAFSTAMKLDASGNLLVGTTSAVNSTSRIASHVAAGNIGIETNSTSTANYYPAIFYNNTSTAGYIQVIGTATTYNSISDYRLKTVIGSVSGAGTRIDALEPIEYEWKSNGERTRGFLAHKFQEVYPQSVSGEKDAVDADGKPVYQAMQASTSEVIADLVAEIQSLRQRVAQLETN